MPFTKIFPLAFTTLALTELKFPCRELVAAVLIRLLRYPEDPRPVLEEVRAVCRAVVLM
jgi:hypothetical protein